MLQQRQENKELTPKMSEWISFTAKKSKNIKNIHEPYLSITLS